MLRCELQPFHHLLLLGTCPDNALNGEIGFPDLFKERITDTRCIHHNACTVVFQGNSKDTNDLYAVVRLVVTVKGNEMPCIAVQDCDHAEVRVLCRVPAQNVVMPWNWIFLV